MLKTAALRIAVYEIFGKNMLGAYSVPPELVLNIAISQGIYRLKRRLLRSECDDTVWAPGPITIVEEVRGQKHLPTHRR